jgi:ABC-2 type transport system permease protein
MRLSNLVVTMRLSAIRMVSDRAGMLVNSVIYVIVICVLGGLWRAGAASSGGSIVGYSAAALTWYIATSEAVTIPLNSRLIAEISEDIVSGSIAVELLRPVSVVGLRVVDQIGRTLPRIAVCSTIGCAVSWWVAGAPPNPVGLLLAAPSVVLAVACNVVAQHCFAALAFWLRHTGASWFLYQKLVFMLGGMLLPIQVLPDVLQRVAISTPFPSMAYAPARLASGHVEPTLLLVQCAWLAVLSVLSIAIFAAGERRLQVVGG